MVKKLGEWALVFSKAMEYLWLVMGHLIEQSLVPINQLIGYAMGEF
jgi:hypothetical protein